MGYDLTPPKITEQSSSGQILQIKSYLIQLTNQLNWALNTLDTAASSEIASVAKPVTGKQPSEADAQNTFNSIKSLIIKSADIVNAYYDIINARLDGEYVAESDFGLYKEQTSQQIEANSTAITSMFTNLQEIQSDVSDIENQIIETNAYIKRGLLYYDDNGAPVYGLEIGQNNTVDGEQVFKKFARFTADRLSFYDQNDTEVAYISDYMLHITNAEITGNLKLGGYMLDTTDGIAFKWVGR